MRILCLVILVVLLVPATVSAATAEPQVSTTPCELAGTWYGGSGVYPYVLTFTPTTANRYLAVGDTGFDMHEYYTFWTAWNGEAARINPRAFDQWGIQVLIPTPETAAMFGIELTGPEVDVFHARMEFTDCNTLVSKIDVYGAYFNYTSDRTFFADPVDLDWLDPDGPITETYHRMPTPNVTPLDVLMRRLPGSSVMSVPLRTGRFPEGVSRRR